MQFVSRGVLTDYDADTHLYIVTDRDNPAVRGWTPNVERVYDLATAFQADGPDEDTGPYRDSGDEDPHA